MHDPESWIKPTGQNEKHQENMGKIQENVQEMQNTDRGHKILLFISRRVSGNYTSPGKNMELG